MLIGRHPKQGLTCADADRFRVRLSVRPIDAAQVTWKHPLRHARRVHPVGLHACAVPKAPPQIPDRVFRRRTLPDHPAGSSIGPGSDGQSRLTGRAGRGPQAQARGPCLPVACAGASNDTPRRRRGVTPAFAGAAYCQLPAMGVSGAGSRLVLGVGIGASVHPSCQGGTGQDGACSTQFPCHRSYETNHFTSLPEPRPRVPHDGRSRVAQRAASTAFLR
jgi:hypothetical protein